MFTYIYAFIILFSFFLYLFLHNICCYYPILENCKSNTIWIFFSIHIMVFNCSYFLTPCYHNICFLIQSSNWCRVQQLYFFQVCSMFLKKSSINTTRYLLVSVFITSFRRYLVNCRYFMHKEFSLPTPYKPLTVNLLTGWTKSFSVSLYGEFSKLHK